MITGNHPLNLTRQSSNQNIDYKTNIVNDALNSYFSNVVINERYTQKKHFTRTSVVPVIALFTNKTYREMFLEYTKNTTDKYTERLRQILLDDNSRKNHYLLMVEKIGDTLNKVGLETFQITTVEYTDATRRSDGLRQKYYLNVKGIKTNERYVKDLSELYLQIKELRAKAQAKKTLSKNA